MIDIHNHILPNIDDGAKSLEQSLEIIKEMNEAGVTDMIVTPHFILGSKYNKNNQEKETLFKTLKEECQKQKIPMNLYLGNEVFLEKNIYELLQQEEIMPLNKSRYLLVELSRNQNHSNIDDLLYSLKRKSIVPILAHPERYAYYQKNPDKLMELKESGVLFQCNLGSFLGEYGKESKKLIMKLLNHQMIDFLSSDVHRPGNNIYQNLNFIKEKYFKNISEEELKEMLEGNAKKVIQDQEIEMKKSKPFKKTLFGKWK